MTVTSPSARLLRATLCAAAAALTARAASDVCSLAVTDLRVDGLARVYAASPRPLLSWRLALAAGLPPSTVAQQSAYRVVASTLPGGVERGTYDAWDSGWIASNATLGVMYGGGGLETAGNEVFWSVLVRDGLGVEIAAAPAAVALVLAPGGAGDPWHGALWITANATMQGSDCECYDPRVNAVPLLRGAFAYSSGAPVVSAHLFLAGLGMYEAFVSGSRVGVAAGRDALLAPNATAFGVSPGEPGAGVGDEVLPPPWTSFGRRVHFSAHDVSALLTSSGPQSIALALGRGWWDPYPMRLFGAFNLREALVIGRPQAIALLVLRFADGSTQRVVTAPNDAGGVSWRTAPGPLTRNNVYIGEGFESDADSAAAPGLAIAGWTRGAFNASAWSAVAEADAYRVGELELNPAPPIRIVAAYAPESIQRGGAPGSWIVSFPKNIAGWVSIAALPASGTTGPAALNLTYAELYNTSSSDIDPTTNIAGWIGHWPGMNIGACAPSPAYEIDTLVLRGAGAAAPPLGSSGYTPKFSWHAFRYVRIDGWPAGAPDPLPAQFTALAVAVDNDRAGIFADGDAAHAAIDSLTANSLQSNWAGGIQSDCPGRERLGYGGDMMVVAEAATLLFDTGPFYAKRVVDYADSAAANGRLPETAPYMGIDSCADTTGGNMQWGSALSEVSRMLYAYAGDVATPARVFDAAAAWVAFLNDSATPAGVLTNALVDAYFTAPGEVGCTSGGAALEGTAFFARQADNLAALADVTGRADDAAAWRLRSAAIAATFRSVFVNASSGVVGLREGPDAPIAPLSAPDAQAWALGLGLLPLGSPLAAAAAAQLHGRLTLANGSCAPLGPFATSLLFAHGHEWVPSGGDPARGIVDDAYALLDAEGYPGYKIMLAAGATGLWEHWETGWAPSSWNHAWLGSVSAFLHRVVGGIGPAPGAVGFDRVLVRPIPALLAAGVVRRGANSSYASVRGNVAVGWTLTAAGVAPAARIVVFAIELAAAPANVQLVIELPLRAPASGADAAARPALVACAWCGAAQLDEAAGVARWELAGITAGSFTATWTL